MATDRGRWPHKTVTLIYSAHDPDHNAVALRDYLEDKLREQPAELRKSA